MWKNVKMTGIVKIEKCVAEFKIWELNISPYAKFRIKIFESDKGDFSGCSNLQVKDNAGNFNSAIGYGKSLEEALQDTLNNFFELTSIKEPGDWLEDDFSCSDIFDF